MFDIGAGELLVIVIVAIIVIGPKEMPRALRTAGRWIGKVRRMSAHFRSGIDTMIREAELEDAEKEWRERNARIMAKSTEGDGSTTMEPLRQQQSAGQSGAESHDYDSRAEAAIARAKPEDPGSYDAGNAVANENQPSLPLDPAAPKKDG